MLVPTASGGAAPSTTIVAAGRYEVGPSFQASLSADGRRVAFAAADEGGLLRVRLHDRDRGTDELVPVAVGDPSAQTWSPDLSASGEVVGFLALRGTLGKPAVTTLQVADLQSGRAVEVSSPVVPEGSADAAGVSSFSLSGDGRHLAFESDLAEVPGLKPGRDRVYLTDASSGHTELLSVTQQGVELVGASTSPVMSGDGNTVAFVVEDPAALPGINFGGYRALPR